MLDVKKRTVDAYKNAGAAFALIELISFELLDKYLATVLPAKDIDRFINIVITRMGLVRSACDTQMFRDHPHLAPLYNSLFFSDLSSHHREGLDEEVFEKARGMLIEILDGLGKEKGE